MADLAITLTIPEAKISTAKQGYFKMYPNIERVDPDDPESALKYTDLQWFKECLRRMVISNIRRGLQVLANENAIVAEDDTIVA